MTDRVRRNGQLSSCEPCRKSKLRCDHKRPVCGRCARRRLSEQQCHYHPAPMARQLTPRSERGTPYQSHGARSITTPSTPSVVGLRPYEPINMNMNLMCFADPNTPQPQRAYTSLTRTGVTVPQLFVPDEDLISQGAKLLSEILDIVTEIGKPLESFTLDEPDLCMHGPFIQVSWKATNDAIRNLLKDRPDTNLEAVSKDIFERTSSPPFFPPTAAGAALETAFSSQALRWDLIGLFCAQIGVYLGGEKDKSFDFVAHKKWKSDRKTLMQRTFRACIQCETFCNQIGSVNDITLWFLLLVILFATWCFGDDSYHVLRLMSSLSSVFFALGFHKGAPTDASVPFYMTEIRRRAIAWAHDHDKVGSSFISRPVHLSRHFCTTDLPLDIPDSALTDTAEVFLKACENLDEAGWSKDQIVLPVSRLRVQLMMCMIREEALELKLGPSTPGLETKAARVLGTLRSTWQSIPPHLKFDAARQKHDLSRGAILLQSLRQEYLYTEFVLHTILANFSEEGRVSLIKTAHEVLNLVLLPTRKRDLLQSNRAEMEWTLVFYAMPCASVLILELLRQKQHPEKQLIMNRSGIIQDISILISCCDSLTESGQSNYQICQQAQSIFSRSLDSILNQNESSHGSNPAEQTMRRNEQEHGRPEQTKSMSPELSNVVAQDPEWMAWLDSLGLQGDPWLDSIVPILEFPMNEVT